MNAPSPNADVPGGLLEHKTRITSHGLIEFEFAPKGYLTRKGEVRKKDWRAYFYTPDAVTCTECAGNGRVPGATVKGRKCPTCKGAGNVAPRTRQTSVTTLLDVVTSKGGLPYWFEGGGIKGTQEAHRRGLLTVDDSLEHAVQVVRAEKLGAEAERDRAADRGLSIHALLEQYMRTGRPPNPKNHPEPHRGYIQALVAWLLAADPEPVAIEELVCVPDDRYAGRIDLVANAKSLGGRVLTTFDAKTQENCGIYMGAHAQLALYNRGWQACGGDEPSRSAVVAFAADGAFREMDLAMSEDAALAALAWWRFAQPVESACTAQNEIEKKARREAVIA